MASTTTTGDTGRSYVYKGKATHRSWPQLPEELIKLIGSFYLRDIVSTAYCPETWESYDSLHQRMIYATLRDGLSLERNVMTVCGSWHRALQNHPIWQRSVQLLDPTDTFRAAFYVSKPVASLGGSAAAQRQAKRHSMWKHLRHIMLYSCIVCRLNSPNTHFGLGCVNYSAPRRGVAYTAGLGTVTVCRDHEKRKSAFCGLCLKDNPSFETASLTGLLGRMMGPGMNLQSSQAFSALLMDIGCLENEDEETWPSIETTCKSCRLEWLWKKACHQAMDREAIGGPPAPANAASLPKHKAHYPIPSLNTLLQNSPDWETRHTVEGFVDMAEGTINDVLTLAREKWWLRKNTKLGDMMGQALAARRWRSLPPHMQPRHQQARQEEPRQGEYESPARIEFESDTTAYPASSPRTNTTTTATATVISLEDGNAEQIEDVDIGSETLSYERYEDGSIEEDDLDESVEDELEDDDEEDASVMQSQENSVRELALGAWARAKILDGFWISPADVWYNHDKIYKGSGMGLDQKYPELEGEAHGEQDGKKVDRRKEGWTLAVHPCPWTIEKESEAEDQRSVQGSVGSSEQEEEEETHPRWETVVATYPPTFHLCEQAYQVAQRQMRTILLPAMKNVVRKIIMECGAASFPETAEQGQRGGRERTGDPVLIATRMTIEDVVRVLREEEGVWFEGYDWLEKRRNEKEASDTAAAAAKRKRNVPGSQAKEGAGSEHEDRESPPKKRRKTKDGEDLPGGSAHDPRDASTTSSTSSEGAVEEDGTSTGSGTSPVLSTTTLQTTPSPPPSTTVEGKGKLDETGAPLVDAVEEEEDEYESEYEEESPIRIPVDPVLASPKLLRPIPYVPLSVKGFPTFTIQALKQTWREACQPLYVCRCRICERAAMAAAAAAQAERNARHEEQWRQQYAQERQRTAPPPTPVQKDEPRDDQ
ncbi:hypothetical protein DFP72DRAFT_827991, partial [Ephemerocybe angulata]